MTIRKRRAPRRHALVGALLLPWCLVAAVWSAQLGGEHNPADTASADSEHNASNKKHSHMKHPANHLDGETSPYLLMHVHNPVDWYPWGEEALAKARDENKPIFLSIGYSSCYWCHVMERESFTDEAIAKYLNDHFVCIKVDREERPDLDDVYMTGVQLMTGRGGWPMSVFLTPEGKPFFGGTYFPPRKSPKYPHEGFEELLQKIQLVWEKKPDDVKKSAEQLTAAIRQQLGQPESGGGKIDAALAAAAQGGLAEDFDPVAGGFGFSATNPRAPKFPEPSKLDFLLQQAKVGDAKATEMLVTSLDHMARGGIYDHLGGGFHRYSTDRFWWVPHFEKMLYDNGQLATVYAEASAATGREDFAETAQGICDFVLREMTDKDGGFYSAIDAETDAEEGKFYVWTDEELDGVLDANEREFLSDLLVWKTNPLIAALDLDARERGTLAMTYGDGPVFEGKHVLMLGRPIAEIAQDRDVTIEELQAKLAPIRDKLFAARAKRERPLTDTKILTAWNGLMIAGMADTGRVLDESEYVSAAAQAADLVLENLRESDGRLLRTYRDGEAKLNAYLDDYAFLTRGLIALHRATGDATWLDAAKELTDKQVELFWDEANGGFFFTSHDHEELIARGKDPIDGALPAGNSVSANNLLYLAGATGDSTYRDRARRTIEALLPWAARSPAHTCGTAIAATELLKEATP